MHMRNPFCQVTTVLGVVYGVNLDSQFSEWLDVLYVFNFDAVDLTLPGSCFGSMRQRILLNALWPYGAIALVVTVIAVQGAVSHMRLAAVPQKQSATSIFLERSLYAAIFISYILLPGASRFIFKARQCVSYDTEDSDGTSRSYLIADLSIQCNGAEDADFAMLDAYFWFFFAVWPVLVPLAYLLLLTKVRSTVRLKRSTPLTNACRFLWRDYNVGLLYWEVVDLLRRLVLTSIILFVDTEHGSGKMLRLVLGAMISAMYLGILALARPYRRPDDLYLACLSNILLACCFVSGIAIKLCEEGSWEDSCYALTSFANSYQSTVFVIILTCIMLVASVGLVAFKTISAVTAPTLHMISSGRAPILELPASCHFHIFISHGVCISMYIYIYSYIKDALCARVRQCSDCASSYP